MRIFIQYIKKHHILWLWVLLFTTISQGMLLLTDTVGIDTADAIRTMTRNDIEAELSVGRQGIVWVKYLTGHILVNPLFAGVLTILALTLASMLWNYLFYEASGVDNSTAVCAFAFILNSSTIFTEMFYFKVQSAEIAIGMCLAALSLLFTYRWIVENHPIYPIAAVLLMLVYMSTYQALVMLYVAGAQMCFCLHYGVRASKESLPAQAGPKSPLSFVSRFVLLFFIGFGTNELISRIFFSAGTAYIDKLFLWGSRPLSECLYHVGAYSFKTLVGIGVHYPETYLPVCILAVIVFPSGKPVKNNLLLILDLLLLVISPAYLPIAIGGRIPVRAQMTLPFVLGFFAWLLFTRISVAASGPRISAASVSAASVSAASVSAASGSAASVSAASVSAASVSAASVSAASVSAASARFRQVLFTVSMILTVLTCYRQVWADLDLSYTDQMRYRMDSLMAHDLIRTIDEIQSDENYPVVFVGSCETPLNPSCIMGETIGHSMFAWDTEAEPAGVYSGGRCLAFLSCFGADYAPADAERIAEIYSDKAVRAMPSYPASGCIRLQDDVIVVKLGEP